jgi:hypothetical protein
MTYARNHSPEVTDEEILRLMNLALLIFSKDGSTLLKWNCSSHKYVSIVFKPNGDARRMKANLRFGAEGREGSRSRTIYRNKLVWMWHHRKVVPEGFVIDHIDEDCTNDTVDNLKLMTYEDSDRQGWELQGKGEEIPF